MGPGTNERSRVVTVGILLIVVAFAMASGHAIVTARWVQDDTYIFLRYAANIMDGKGPVFNAGERVCGFTSPLWTGLVCPLFLLRQDPTLLATLMSAVLGAVAIVLLVLLFPEEERAAAGLPAAALLLLAPPFRVWAISGMEVSLFLVLVIASLSLLRNERYVLGGVTVGLAIMTRPEGVLLGLACLCALLVRHAPGRAIRRAVAAALFVAIPWWVFSTVYYGMAIPHSVIAKRIVYSEVLFSTGPVETLRALAASGVLSAGMTGLALVGFIAERRNVARHIDVILFGVLYLVFYIVGRTFIHDWYVPPVVLVQAYGTGLAIRALVRLVAGRTGRRAQGAVGIAVVAVVCLLMVPLARRATLVLRSKQEYMESTLHHVATFSREWPHEGSILVNAIGCVGFYGDRHVIDSLGLVSPGVLSSFRRREWVEPIRAFEPAIVVLGPTAGTEDIESDAWFREEYVEQTRFGARPELVARGGTYERVYRVFVRAADVQ